MPQINTCLKRTFTIFNLFFAIIGGAIIVLALLCQSLTNINGGNMEGRTTSLLILYVVGGITMVIAILGAYGAHKESKVCLIVFLVCMVIGSLLMLRAGIPSAIVRPQLEGILEQKFRQFVPLDKASDEVKNIADALQTGMHCCGLFSYTDWEDEIPSSCLCNEEEEMEGLCKAADYTRLLQFRSQKLVYAKPCFPMLMHYVLLMADIVLGVIFTLAILAVLGMMLSSIMIHQMRYPERPTLLMHVPAIFTTPPPKYEELHNPPQY
ncbi:tetraspanin-8-like [Morone saxatilis]|uniref:tetraspanin-8-like n=1 Tax=Morone saxatilis TaxID=34816 RepID=UPI0015E240A6|nr:tetraspanin-8-like [Morone saxatilis]